MLRWNTPEKLRALLCELVSWESGTGSYGEARFPFRLAAVLREIPHFAQHPDPVTPGPDAATANYATALYRHPDARDTIILVSHYDTVDTAEYGALEALAHDPERLGAAMLAQADQLGPDVAADARSGAYLFGRGTADMKAGLALHMALLERAVDEAWPINLLLLTVADEEVGSAGMRSAVEDLDALRAQHDLNYVLVLNSEPSFPEQHGDDRTYVHTGSIGKIMPAAICVGRETHAGTPLDGLTSTYIASWLTREMEWCDEFREEAHGETTPLPVTLWQRDLRAGYSTQTTSRTSAFYNVFVMRRSAAEVLERFEAVARRVAAECTSTYHARCAREGVDPIGSIRVLRFEQLVTHATDRFGADVVARVLTDAAAEHADDDAGSQSTRMADALLVLCPELAPAIVVLFAPPYYPPVNSSDDALVRACVERLGDQAALRFGRTITQRHWFRAISDLSYVDYAGDDDGWQAYERNTPGFGTTYRIPFAAMQRLRVPVLNVGPRGRDLHMRTERLECHSAFEELPALLVDLVTWVADRIAQE